MREAWLGFWLYAQPAQTEAGLVWRPAEVDFGLYLHRGQREWKGRAVDWRRHKRLLGEAYRQDAERWRAL